MLCRYYIFKLVLVIAVCCVQIACDSNHEKSPGDISGRVTSLLKICEDNGIRAGIPRVYSGLASVACQRGKYALSEEYFRKGIEMCENNGDRHTTAALPINWREKSLKMQP